VIQIYVNPGRVEEISLVCQTELEQDLDLAAWVAIRPLVQEIDAKLRAIVREFVGDREKETGA